MLAYWPVFSLYARQHWNEMNLHGAYAHAPLAVLLILFLVWRERKTLSAPGPMSMPVSAILLLSVAALSKIYGEIQGYVVLQGMSLIPLLLGLLQTRHDNQAWRSMRYPVLFLLFIIPLPGAAIDALTQPLVTLTGEMVSFILPFLQVEATRAGQVFIVNAPGLDQFHEIILAPECSGIRSFISLLAMSSLYAHLRNHKTGRSVVLLLLTIPFAILGNTVRVTLTMLLTIHVRPDAAESFYHTFSGVLLFSVTLFILVTIDNLFDRPRTRTGKCS
jgi:exosortase